MTNLFRWGIAALAVLSLACSDASRVTAPATPATPAQSGFPAILRPGLVYNFAGPLGYPVSVYANTSRYVLYADGTFVLQYANRAEYHGTYSVANDVVTFVWAGWSVAGPWGATGTLTNDSLSVRYNLVMQMSDFEDAVYRLAG